MGILELSLAIAIATILAFVILVEAFAIGGVVIYGGVALAAMVAAASLMVFGGLTEEQASIGGVAILLVIGWLWFMVGDVVWPDRLRDEQGQDDDD